MKTKPSEKDLERLLANLSSKVLDYAKFEAFYDITEAECIPESDKDVEEDCYGIEDLDVEPANQETFRQIYKTLWRR